MNLVCQSIGVLAVFAARANNFKDIIIIGKLTQIPQTQNILAGVGELFGVSFHKPKNAENATAIGAALHVYLKEKK